MTTLARGLDRLIHWYQILTEGRISPCRYVPSCSTYAREALAEHGTARGGWYATRRLLRCQPWGGHGYDPVPGTGPNPPDTTRSDPRPARRTS